MKSFKELFILITLILVLAGIYSVRGLVERFFNYVSVDNNITALQLENKNLKFQLSQAKKNISLKTPDGITAFVYSQYPFADKKHIVINEGSLKGIKKGMAALTPGGFLLGKVVEVKPNKSKVKTIFDPDWKLSVGIGDKETQALFGGGDPPSVDLIPSDQKINKNAEIFTASSDLPFHTLIGYVKNLSGNPEKDIWLKSNVEVPYDIGDINEVTVVNNL